MRLRYGITDILWGALRAMDSSKDTQRDSGTVLRVKREMLRAIAQLESGKPEQAATMESPLSEPDSVA